jgi:hypothetical protein
MVEQCTLLEGGFAMFLQFMIGIVALSSLVYKRYVVEPEPRRPYEVWCMDVGKQVIQSVFIHFSNIGLAIMISDVALNGKGEHDECAFYFISFTLDTFVGVLIIYLVLKLSTVIAEKYDIPPLKEHGYYGEPPQSNWYIMQLGVFIFASIISKASLGMLMWLSSERLSDLGNWLFRPVQSVPAFELLIVMVICPMFMSMLQYWCVDNFLMDNNVNERHSYAYIDDDDSMMGNGNRQYWDSLDAKTSVFFNPI